MSISTSYFSPEEQRFLAYMHKCRNHAKTEDLAEMDASIKQIIQETIFSDIASICFYPWEEMNEQSLGEMAEKYRKIFIRYAQNSLVHSLREVPESHWLPQTLRKSTGDELLISYPNYVLLDAVVQKAKDATHGLVNPLVQFGKHVLGFTAGSIQGIWHTYCYLQKINQFESDEPASLEPASPTSVSSQDSTESTSSASSNDAYELVRLRTRVRRSLPTSSSQISLK